MRTIGIIGGMSWESTVTYYRVINQEVARTMGGLHSAQILLFSVDFHQIEELQRVGDWEKMGDLLAAAASALERGGADFVVLATNTMHKVADAISRAIALPFLHIADATADAIDESGFHTIGLLGTRYTMEQDFYRSRLTARGLEVLTPDEAERGEIHRIIFEELCRGKILEPSRELYRRAIYDLADRGAEAVILGCTEIGLLVGENDVDLPVFDTTLIHARAAARIAMEDPS